VSFSDVKKYPTVFGWQINNISEGKILGNYIAKTWAGKKVGIVFQNDDFGQHMAQGFEEGIGKANPIAGKQPYESSATSMSTQAAALKAAGAEVVPMAATGAFIAQFVKAADASDYHPQILFNWSSGDPSLLKLVGDPKLVEGAVMDEFMPLYTDTSNPKVAKYKAIWDKRGDGKPFGVLAMYGMAEGQTMVKALELAGKDLTRPGIVKAVESIKDYTDTVVSVPFGFSPEDHAGITSAQIVQIKNGQFDYQKPIYNAPMQGDVTTKG
jgi:branched-chain amino acid transport system substrate-binding protein